MKSWQLNWHLDKVILKKGRQAEVEHIISYILCDSHVSEGAKKNYFLDNVSNMYSEAFSYSIENSIQALYLA